MLKNYIILILCQLSYWIAVGQDVPPQVKCFKDFNWIKFEGIEELNKKKKKSVYVYSNKEGHITKVAYNYKRRRNYENLYFEFYETINGKKVFKTNFSYMPFGESEQYLLLLDKNTLLNVVYEHISGGKKHVYYELIKADLENPTVEIKEINSMPISIEIHTHLEELTLSLDNVIKNPPAIISTYRILEDQNTVIWKRVNNNSTTDNNRQRSFDVDGNFYYWIAGYRGK